MADSQATALVQGRAVEVVSVLGVAKGHFQTQEHCQPL